MIKTFLNRLPPWGEFAIVVIGAFGYFIVTSVYSVSHPDLLLRPHHNNTSLVLLGVLEGVVLLILSLFLVARGWTAAKLGLEFKPVDLGNGLGLALVAYLAYFAAWIVFGLLAPRIAVQASHVVVIGQGISLTTALIMPWVNGFYEELFVVGYVITTLKEKHGLSFAINVSVAIRLMYHLYQGPMGIVAVLPLGLIFGYWYARNGRLWPLVVAHALIDLVGMLTAVAW